MLDAFRLWPPYTLVLFQTLSPSLKPPKTTPMLVSKHGRLPASFAWVMVGCCILTLSL